MYNTTTSSPQQAAQPITWLTFLYCLIVPAILVALRHTDRLDRPTLPRYSPLLWDAYHWPILGSALRFYSRRRDMVAAGTRASPNGTFSFFIGRKHIVNLGGLNGRRTFFENKEFSVSQGFVELLTGLVSSNDARDDYGAAYFVKCVAALSRGEKLARRLPVLTSDVRDFCNDLNVQEYPKPDESERWRVTDVTQSVYTLLYRLVQRSLGATEMAENEKLMRHTLHIFETFESSTSLAHIIFPWMVTPNYVIRQISGARLYMIIKKILKQRKTKKQDDALQHVHDEDGDDDKTVRFIFSALSSSVTMTGAAITWLPAFLADSLEWQAKCRREVDTVLLKHRKAPSQSRNEILESLSLQDWESEFPVLYLCLQETLRLVSTGTFFRKNVSGADIRIGDSADVVPHNSYAAYLPDNVHMDPQLYPDPLTFNPSRHCHQNDPEERDPHTFLGWGSGRHLCAGMRLAKLEINLVLVHMLANFEWELSDKRGGRKVGELPKVDRNMLRPEKSRMPLYIRYKCRA